MLLVIASILLIRQATEHPDYVDLRGTFDRHRLTVCNQRGPLCWDYTVVGLAEYEYAVQHNDSVRLSPGFLSWAAKATDSESQAGSNFGRAYRGLKKYGLAPLDLGGDPDDKGNGKAPNDATLRAAADLGRIDVHWIRFWNTQREMSDEELSAIEEDIANGHPVAVGMRWPNQTTFNRAYVLDVPERNQIFDGHCVALVGYMRRKTLPGGGAFLFRNSWGADWADHGYAWMPFSMLRFCINDALSLRTSKPLPSPGPGTLRFEAEKLDTTGSAAAPTVQDMSRFGPNWRGRKQLFFAAKKPGEQFCLNVPVDKAGNYQLRLFITRAEDYGQFNVAQVTTGGLTVPIRVDGAGPGVSRSAEVFCGDCDLTEGTTRFLFTVVGKSSASHGMYVGIDAIELVPVE